MVCKVNKYQVAKTVAFLTVALTGCGGGGGGGVNVSANTETAPKVDAKDVGTLLTILPTSTYKSGSRDAELFAQINAARGAEFGYLVQSEQLDKAATAHALYIQTAFQIPEIDPDGNHYSENGVPMYKNGNPNFNNVTANRLIGAHVEEIGRLNFTGVTSGDRAFAAGYVGAKTSAVSEVIAEEGLRFVFKNPCVDQFLSSVFHRSEILSTTFSDIGIGSSALLTFTTRTCVLNLSYPSTPRITPNNWTAVYPRDGSSNIPTRMWTHEVPDPASDYKVKGMPISFHGTPGKALIVSDFKLTGPSGLVKTRLLTNSDSSYIKSSEAFILPDGALEGSTKYTVAIVAEIGGIKINKTWSFTTTLAGDAGRL